ncbi:MAG: signal recognition particle protein [Dehalococcoidia bacterium]|nr:signal recognition particle protein [Dehalococcoidia bacterium]
MLDALSERLQATFRRLGSRGKITEADLDAALREVRVALLEADVNLKVVRDLIVRVRERALGADVMRSITPGQQVIGIVHRELVEVLGHDQEPLRRAAQPPTVILLCGVKGSGKTTLAARLGLHLKQQGQRPLLVSTDFERVAGAEQLRVLGAQIDVPVYTEERPAPAAAVGSRALAEAKRSGATAVVIDTRGAVAFDDALADELAALADAVDPTEVLLVVDAMAGQEAVNIARQFDEAIEGTGIVVTKVDSDTRGGAVLSVREVTGLPVKFITTGERLDALESFYPDRFASRVLGMGDVVTLVEKAQQTLGERDAKEVARRVRSGEFDLEDFLQQLQQVQKMGPLSGLLEMIPGMGGMQQQLKGLDAEGMWKQSEAIIYSMTAQERRSPELLNGSRRRRVARGSGTTPADVNRLLNQFKEAKKLMQAMATGKGAGALGRIVGR